MPWTDRARTAAGGRSAGASRRPHHDRRMAARGKGYPPVSYASAPASVRSLEQRIRNLEGDEGLVQRRRVSMALVVVGQMLPEGAIKGGSAMALRYGRGTRFTQDLDAART